uniref:Uncharacterized protein n=1 Tax=Sciurus vulgaris TaxID=55149 RepID=A0A8D2JP34_SCIVU
MAEDNGLANGDAAINVAQSLIFVFPVLTQYVILSDVVQGQLLFAQLDDIRVRNDSLSKLPHRVLKCCREQEHLAFGGQKSLGVNHHICFIQDKHTNLSQINQFSLKTPIEDSPRSANYNLKTIFDFFTFSSSNF